MTRYEIIYDIWYNMMYGMIWYMIWYDMLYLLTAIGLTSGGSSTVHIYTQTVHRTTQLTQKIHRTTQKLMWKSVVRVPSLRVIPQYLPYNWGKSTEKGQGSRRVPVGMMKTEYTEQSIHNNNNT